MDMVEKKMDRLLDRDCVIFDGKCDCEWPKDDCKYVSMKKELHPVRKNPCIKGMTVETCPHNPILGCDCKANPPRKVLKSFAELKDNL